MIKIIPFNTLKTGSETTAIAVSEDINEFSGEKIYYEIEKKGRDLNEFKGKQDKSIIFYFPENIPAQKIILSGLGEKNNINYETLRNFASNCVKQAIKSKTQVLDIIFPDISKIEMEEEKALKALIEGACLTNYIFNDYKSKKENTTINSIRIAVDDKKTEDLEKISQFTETLCEYVCFARNIVSTPPMDKRPSKLKKILVENAEKAGMTTKVLDGKELKEKGFNSHLGVSRGSSEDAYLVIMEYIPENYDETIVLVGKGITFDSGGLDLKPPSGMEDMKLDMGGAAAVSGAAAALAKSGVSKKIITLVPIAENMPSGDSYRPGDVLQSYNGKTIEVLNTDAEGRLILADALSYAEKLYNPDLIIDVATLTGACMVALGNNIAGVFTNHDKTGKEIVEKSEEINEPCWQLPLYKGYSKMLKSSIADLKNIGGGRYGGAITAALFLKEFIEKSNWVHIDIAGPAFAKEDRHYISKGGTGFGVRLLTEYILSRK
ncbi:MAG: leucyl aminopeptidase [Deltaproteobacteria bacterium]|nr:MAG: leucyl aminopeptidase [Deltaproteobacteria bacterium]